MRIGDWSEQGARCHYPVYMYIYDRLKKNTYILVLYYVMLYILYYIHHTYDIVTCTYQIQQVAHSPMLLISLDMRCLRRLGRCRMQNIVVPNARYGVRSLR